MEFILVRHAEPVRAVVEDGFADPHLTPRGLAQAEAPAAHPGLGPIDAIVTSPSQRAIQTAAPTATRCGLTPTVVENLAEWDWGASTYVPIEQLKATNDQRYRILHTGQPYGDVDIPAFRRRVISAFADLAATNPNRRLMVVSHGVINAYLGDVLRAGGPLLWFHPSYTGTSRVAVDRDGRRTIRSVNETAHLLPAKLMTEKR